MSWLIGLPNWRMWLALVVVIGVATSHWFAYRAGSDHVKQDYQARAAKLERQAREREHALAAAKQKVEEAYESHKAKAARAAVGARTELDRLRDTLTARATTGAATACACPDAAPAPERKLLGECAQAATDLAGEADRLAAQLTGLQGYVRSVCTAPQ